MGQVVDLGMTGYQVLGLELASTEVEAVAADIKEYHVGALWTEVIMFGVYITEDFVAQATDPVVRLAKRSTAGGALTVIKDLTLGSSNANALKRGDGTSAHAVAIAADADLDNGHVVLAMLNKEPTDTAPDRVLNGALNAQGVSVTSDILVIRHQVAATGAGGAYRPFVVVKIGGSEPRNQTVWMETLDGTAVV